MPAAACANLVEGLSSPTKVIPTAYLYDDRGSALYDDITELVEYYPYLEEQRLLTTHADEIATYIPKDSIVVELGCGNASKTIILLQAVAKRHGRCHFAGIDVSAAFLADARANVQKAISGLVLPKGCKPAGQPCHVDALVSDGGSPDLAVTVETVEADYLEGLREVRRRHPSAMLTVLWLGSSVGNLTDDQIVAFFRAVHRITGPNMQLFLCADLWKDHQTLFEAYCDPHGVTEAFIKNGARNAFASLGHSVSQSEEATWRYDVVVNAQQRRVEMWLQFPEGVPLQGGGGSPLGIKPGERVLMEISRKFLPSDIAALASRSALQPLCAWRSRLYSMQLLLPDQAALRLAWRDSDATFAALPDWALHPISFRHPFCFYYGHVAAFTLLKLLPNHPPSPLDTMFSRGIDPNLLDPSQCHSHPEVPQAWPCRAEIEAYVEGTRALVLEAMGSEEPPSSRLVSLALEHERMHHETLAYMLLQAQAAELRASLAGASLAGAKAGATQRGPSEDSPSPTPSSTALSSNGRSSSTGSGSGSGSSSSSSSTGNSEGSSDASSDGSGDCDSCDMPGAGGMGDAAAAAAAGAAPPLASPLQVLLDVTIPAGPISLGTDTTGATDGFVWDNEGPPRAAAVTHTFAVSSAPVTVAQFHAFVTELGGYGRQELWEEEDYAFLLKHGIKAPASWVDMAARQGEEEGRGEEGGGERPGKPSFWVCGWGREPRPWQEVAGEAVMVSLAEAQAFCRAVGGGHRIMTEEEWYRIVQWQPQVVTPAAKAKARAGGEGGGAAAAAVAAAAAAAAAVLSYENSAWKGEQLRGSSGVAPATGLRHGSGGKGLSEEQGPLEVLQQSVREEGWEWTSTAFAPFPGFQPMPEYPEYSTDFFDGVHFVLKGCSRATHPSLKRDSFRNYYQRQYPFMFAKFRCCKELQ